MRLQNGFTDRHASKGYVLAVTCLAVGITLGFFVIPALMLSMMVAEIVMNIFLPVSELFAFLIGISIFYSGAAAVMFATEAVVELAVNVACTIVDGISNAFSSIYYWFYPPTVYVVAY